MQPIYRIHPAVGVARLGNSPDAFHITPETLGGLPIACDDRGNALLNHDGTEVVSRDFKDEQGRIAREAARFRIYVHDDESPDGRELRLGDPIRGGGNTGLLQEISWRVYLANKKSGWYEFQQLQGEHGYASDHPRRNADITDDSQRQRLIIDPGPVVVNTSRTRRVEIGRNRDAAYSPSFPPKGLKPFDIDTLGAAMTDDAGRLLVLGGHGHAGSFKDGFADPIITSYANNDGWFDDTSDGAVMARLKFWVPEAQAFRYIDVEMPAWVIVGYPGYVPEIADQITMTDVVEDMFVRQFASRPDIYGTAPYSEDQRIDPADPVAVETWLAQQLSWNADYKPWFWRDIWPILKRPNDFAFLTNVLSQSNYPHDTTRRGTFNPDTLGFVPQELLGTEPATEAGQEKLARLEEMVAKAESRLEDAQARGEMTEDQVHHRLEKVRARMQDPYRPARQFLWNALRRPGQENLFNLYGQPHGPRQAPLLPLMPLLAGDNPITNNVPSKFLRLTDLQLFLLGQWAKGDFINEKEMGWLDKDATEWPQQTTPGAPTGRELDRGVLQNVLGGAFCPGGEVGWVMRNPSIWHTPWQVKSDAGFANFNQTPASAYKYPSQDWAFATPGTLSLDQNLDTGVQPGDLTKYMALPWQADFNECSFQTVDITFPQFNNIYPDSVSDSRLTKRQSQWPTLWWPAHRPMQVNVGVPDPDSGKLSYVQMEWARGITQTTAGDLDMVSAWSRLGFVIRNPDFDPKDSSEGPEFIETQE